MADEIYIYPVPVSTPPAKERTKKEKKYAGEVFFLFGAVAVIGVTIFLFMKERKTVEDEDEEDDEERFTLLDTIGEKN